MPKRIDVDPYAKIDKYAELTPQERKALRIEIEREESGEKSPAPSKKTPLAPVAEVPEEPEVPEEIDDPEPEGNGSVALTAEQIAAFEEKDIDKEIPGRGHLFHVKEKHLPESTRLNEKEILGFAIGDVQQAVLDHGRTRSVFEILKFAVFRNKISFGGEGRKESIILHQLTAEEKEAARGGMFGTGS